MNALFPLSWNNGINAFWILDCGFRICLIFTAYHATRDSQPVASTQKQETLYDQKAEKSQRTEKENEEP